MNWVGSERKQPANGARMWTHRNQGFHSGGLACLFGEIETNFRWAAHPRVVLGLIRPKAFCFISTPMRAALATVGRLRAKLSDPTWPTQALEED